MTLDTEAEVRGHFSAELDARRAARRFLTDALSGWGEDNLTLDDARCVVTELANNAVLHAGSRLSVVIRSDAAQLRIAVADARPARPAIDLPCAVCSTRRSPPGRDSHS